jgi:methylmalonic aciduria homocystinuria type C protein
VLRYDEVVRRVRAGCERWGFDLTMPLQVGWYNAGVEPALRLDDFGANENLAIIIGNTRALWPIWRAALERDPPLATSADPLDLYTVRALNDVVAGLGVRVSLRFSHEGGGRRIAMQRLAHAAGLAYLTETHMSVHPVYGPWIALRAAVSVAMVGPPTRAPVLPHPCGGCAHACFPAFERAVSTLGVAPNEANMQANWQLWLACRDACPVGREHRYSDAQIHYHYLRERPPPSDGPRDTRDCPSK